MPLNTTCIGEDDQMQPAVFSRSKVYWLSFLASAGIAVMVAAVAIASGETKIAAMNGGKRPERLRVSENGRFLVTESGKPVFVMVDTAWGLPARLKREEVAQYLRTRKTQYFNFAMRSIAWSRLSSNVTTRCAK